MTNPKKNSWSNKSIHIRMDVCVYVRIFEHNSGTPRAISTKLGTHIAICMCKMVWETGNLDDSHC
jgi:hypothetical protein